MSIAPGFPSRSRLGANLPRPHKAPQAASPIVSVQIAETNFAAAASKPDRIAFQQAEAAIPPTKSFHGIEANVKPPQDLHDLGQSLWLDNIARDLLSSGTERSVTYPATAIRIG